MHKISQAHVQLASVDYEKVFDSGALGSGLGGRH